MQDRKSLGTPGYGNELSLMQPEESLLNDEEKHRFQATAVVSDVPCTWSR